MTENNDLIKLVAPLATPVLAALVDTHLKPRLAKLYNRLSVARLVEEQHFISKFEEYLARCARRHGNLRSLTFRDTPKSLLDLYVPLTVQLESRRTGYPDIRLDKYSEEFIPKLRKVLVIDTAGMGKSTLLKFLYLRCISESKGIPVLVELRRLSPEHSIVDYMISELSSIDIEFERELILQLIKEGGFVFFLDGYDEVKDSDKNAVTKHLQDFIARADNNDFILSSRSDTALSCFDDFYRYKIKPLSLAEAADLLVKYDEGRGLAEHILEQLKLPEVRSRVLGFLSNPFLVSLLYYSFAYKPTIPGSKHLYYELVFDALFESHDLTKDRFERQKLSGLDKSQFHAVLRALAFVTCKESAVEYTQTQLVGYLSQADRLCPALKQCYSHFIEDITGRVPLFAREGEMLRWSHKSLQDYFAAAFVCLDGKEQQSAILKGMFARWVSTGKYENVLDLCYDIDYAGFRNAIIYPELAALAEEFRALGYPEACFEFTNHYPLVPHLRMTTLTSTLSINKTMAQIGFRTGTVRLSANGQSRLDYFRSSGYRAMKLLQLLVRKQSGIVNSEFCHDNVKGAGRINIRAARETVRTLSSAELSDLDSIFAQATRDTSGFQDTYIVPFVGPLQYEAWNSCVRESLDYEDRGRGEMLANF